MPFISRTTLSRVMEKYTRHPNISGVLSQIAGAHLAHWSGNVKCMQSMLFIKPPGYQGQSWHQDENYIPTRDRSLIGAWIAIDDAYVENGCMWVIPGSQRAGYLFPTRKHGDPDEFDTHDDMAVGFDESPQVPVEVKAGSASSSTAIYCISRCATARRPVTAACWLAIT